MRPAARLFLLIPLTLFIIAAVLASSAHAQEFSTKELKRDGDLAVYISGWPNKTEVSRIKITVCVWNATPEYPLVVQFNEQNWTITRDGAYTWETHEPGWHNVTIRSERVVFAHGRFYIKPPEKKPMITIMLERLQEMLKNVRMETFMLTIGAALFGMMLGYGAKKGTKIDTNYALVPAGIILFIAGYYGLENYYWLAAMAIAMGLTYKVLPEFCKWLVLVKIDKNGIDSERIACDQETDEYLAGFSWRGLIRKELVLKDPYPILFDGENAVVVSEVVETDEKLIVKGDPALARALMDAEIVRKLDAHLARVEARNRMLEEAKSLAVFTIIRTIEDLRRAYRARPERATLRAIEERLARLLEQLELTPERGGRHVQGAPQVSG